MPNNTVKICEMGPRDGLQNEAAYIDTKTKIDFINKLSNTGLGNIEVSSFVNPKRVPQMADAANVFKEISRKKNVLYSALVPNELGLQNALDCHPDSIAVFTTVSESFSKKNINCSISESLQRFASVIKKAQDNEIPVRAYISCVMGCPYEGFIQPEKVAELAKQLI
ncbi:MAG: hydroxymethylglutaryl-CoA lyase, partial [Gammaproteobacteria bacterium]|nr:hydroxymethylglutaryl-CoA lyase [Gammaproteobacteria bacterium]